MSEFKEGNHLEGLKIVLTGNFDSYDRKEATQKLESLGADVTSAVSGKTMVLFVGSDPGSKVQKAEKRGLPILDEAAMLAMIGGKTLEEVLEDDSDEAGNGAEQDKPKTSTPWVEPHPRDGEFVEKHENGQIAVQGEYVDGLKHGVWKAFWPNGQLKQEYHWDRGLKHGPELDWTEDGTQVCKGENDHHVRKGTWTWWYEDGTYKHAYTYDDEGNTHGPYKWDTEDGEPRARGAFWHGKRDGDWEWHHEPNYERTIRGYRRGSNHGEEAGWYYGGQLAYQRFYLNGYKHGEFEEYYEDGSPKSKGSWQWGVPVGEHYSWTQDGEENVVSYTDGIAELPSEKKLEKLPQKLAKARDEWAKKDALGDLVEYGERAAFAYYVWKNDIYDIAADPHLWDLISSGLAGLFSGDDVVEFLKTAQSDINGAHLPYWQGQLDHIVMHTYARDPEPIDEAWESLPDHSKKGVAFVRARFGKDVGDVLADEMGALAKKHAKDYGLRESVLWPTEDGIIENRTIFDRPFRKPTEHFDEFIEIFGGMERWIEALRPYALEESKEAVSRVQFPIFRQLIERADVDEMITLTEGIALDNFTQDLIHKALWDWRGDDAETMTKIALGIDDDGLCKWPAVCAAILKHGEEGNEIPQELVDAFVIGTESPTYTSSWATPDEVPEEFRSNPHYLASYLDLSPGGSTPRVSLVHDALALLDEDQIRSIFDRYLESDFRKKTPIQYLYLLDDHGLYERFIEIAEADTYGHQPRVAWGFGEVGLPIVPLLIQALDRASKNDFRQAWKQGILVALARAADDGDEIPEEYDEYINFGVARAARDYGFIQPYVQRLLYNLPTERALPIIEEAFGKETYFWRALEVVPCHPTPELVERAAARVLELEATMDHEKNRALTVFLKGLENPRDWVKWFLQNGGGAACKSGLESAIGYPEFAEVEKELSEQGIEKPKELDAIDRVLALAEKRGNKGEKFYLLRRLDDAKTDSLNVLGGAAPGVGKDRWPLFDEEPMAHLFTLDLGTMPELAEHYDARAVSVFCAQPHFNEAWEPGNDWTAVVFTTEEQLAEEVELPEDVEAVHEAVFEPVAVRADLADETMSKEIWQAGGRVLGDPIWLQSEEYWGDFIMQFDESFCHMNLGDSGVMYVFADTAFWQCY